jgi:hypothetical protein
MLPAFLLGHNALIGVNHRDHTTSGPKREMGAADRALLETAVALGVRGVVLDNHPVALEAARYLATHGAGVSIVPMVPYAQAVVDDVSRGGVGGVVRAMARSAGSVGFAGGLRTAGALARGNLPGAGSGIAVAHYLRDFPRRKPGVVFLHNTVTDLFVAWGAQGALRGYADAVRARGGVPGFVTLNPGRIPQIERAVGPGCWFMCAVNSAGVQMSPGREDAEAVLQDPGRQVVAMSVLAGGMLDPATEIPRALAFPAVKSVVVGTSRAEHLKRLVEIVRATPKGASL